MAFDLRSRSGSTLLRSRAIGTRAKKINDRVRARGPSPRPMATVEDVSAHGREFYESRTGCDGAGKRVPRRAPPELPISPALAVGAGPTLETGGFRGERHRKDRHLRHLRVARSAGPERSERSATESADSDVHRPPSGVSHTPDVRARRAASIDSPGRFTRIDRSSPEWAGRRRHSGPATRSSRPRAGVRRKSRPSPTRRCGVMSCAHLTMRARETRGSCSLDE